MVRIENWSIVSKDYYKADSVCLKGEVYGHPRHKDGNEVLTTRIVQLDLPSRTALTKSGTIYQLGTPNLEYVKECREQNSIYADLLEEYLIPELVN